MLFGILFFFLLSVFGAVADDACPPTEIVKYAELYTSPHLHPCQKASAGFSLVPPMGYPTDPQVKAMCASDACVALIKDVIELLLPVLRRSEVERIQDGAQLRGWLRETPGRRQVSSNPKAIEGDRVSPNSEVDQVRGPFHTENLKGRVPSDPKADEVYR